MSGEPRRKGIVLAGGAGTRLHPVTLAVSKQLMPVYDKPMIYYPITVLMLAGLREIAVITTPADAPAFRRLLGDGAQWGVRFEYIEQPSPDGLAQAYLLAERFLDGAASALVLGDNLFFGDRLPERLRAAAERASGGTVFGYRVADPSRYGVVEFDAEGRVVGLAEKPIEPKSDHALTGLYFFDETASDRARLVKPSPRGEFEIVDVMRQYLEEGALRVEKLGRGFAWLDTGTHESLLDAGLFIRTIEERQGLKIGCPEEVAFRMGFIDRAALAAFGARAAKTQYGRYLLKVAEEG